MLIYKLLFYFLPHYYLKLPPNVDFSVSTLSAVSGSAEVVNRLVVWKRMGGTVSHCVGFEGSNAIPVALFAPC